MFSKIKTDLDLPKNTRLTTLCKIFQEVIECKKEGVKYIASTNLGQSGRKVILENNSMEAQIIADNVESGLSSIACWAIVNQHLKEQLLPSLTLSSVYGCIHRMNPSFEKIGQIKQGSTDPNASNPKARFC